MFKLLGNRASIFVVLTMLVLVIGFPGIASTVKATTPNNDWTAQPLFRARPAAAGGPSGYSPAQITSAYDLTSTANGAGTTIAIIDAYNDSTIASDLATFNSYYTLATSTLDVHTMASTLITNSAWAIETSLDVEWAHAIAPEATILLVEARSSSTTDLMAAVSYAKSSPAGVPPVKAVSMSWGDNEFSTENTYDSYFTSTSGIVFFASSGDNGATVIWPSSSPNVVSVGGTTLNVTATGALISETAWDESGGGVSAYEKQPNYQANYGLTYTERATPDVSFDANPSTGVSVYDSTPYNGNETGWFVVGGTSVGAPSWAAIQALGLTTGNNNFYQDAAPSSTTYSSYFRDITVGSNGNPAGTGYDLATGLGSPVTTNFAPSTTPDFSISASPHNPINIDVGSSATDTITVNSLNQFAGTVQLTSTAPTGIIASLNSTSITTSGTSTLTVQIPTTTATGTYSVTVTGVSRLISHSITITVQVYNLTVSPPSITMDVSQGQTFMTSVSGGISPYTYHWYLDGIVVGTNSSSYTFDASAVGLYTLYVNITDSSAVHVTVESNIALIAVNSTLIAPTVSNSKVAIDQGQTSILTSTPLSTGTSPYIYQWFQKAPGAGSYSPIGGATSSDYSFVASSSMATEAWNFKLQVTDATSAVVTSNSASVMVNSALAAPTASASAGTVDLGQTSALSSTVVTTGTSPYIYQWLEMAPGASSYSAIIGATSPSFSFVTSATTIIGAWSFELQVTDNMGSVVVSSVATVTVATSPTVSVSPVGPLTMDAGQVQAFSAAPNGGAGTLSYQWYLDGVAVSGATGASYSYTASGTSHSITCKVTDSASTPVTSPSSNAVSVTVNQLYVTVTQGANGVITPETTIVDYGGNTTFTITPNTGYFIASLTVDGFPVPVASSYTFSNVQMYNTITATFESNTYTIVASAGTDGSISPSGNVSVNYGDSQSFIITPNSGYYVVDVAVNGSSVGAVNYYTFSNVQAGSTISATFAQNSIPSPSPTTTPSSLPIATPTSRPSTTTLQPTLPPSSSPTPSSSASITVAELKVGRQLTFFIIAIASITIITIATVFALVRKRQPGDNKVVAE